ncbi:hypothetical protein VCR31J2_1360077 [Vibrio coralliirubri]|uniref:Uncharacterized protein n=1 Tax=Vibrio coralliirubri TaxID=1516159 RepID=A0AA86WPZ6_9VIBR|nr:hypothetical protein VCR31J2_1360077 [Vibrio coralliirubri]
MKIFKSNEYYHGRSRLKQQWRDAMEEFGQLASKLTALR